MKSHIRKIYRLIIPKKIRLLRFTIINKLFINSVIEYYSKEINLEGYDSKKREDIQKIIATLKVKGRGGEVPVFPLMGESVKKQYSLRYIDIHKDAVRNLNYISLDGKRMYFKRNMSRNEIQDYFNSVSLEQDYSSPHRYFSNDRYFFGVGDGKRELDDRFNSFGVNKGDVVVDLGAAEGNFALSVIDLVKKIYIFECDEGWIEALEATFEPYKSKAHIVKKYVGDKNDDDNTTLDKFFIEENDTINYIKFDIEGAEEKALKNAQEVIEKSNHLKIALCTYHRPQDELLFSKMLEEKGFTTCFTNEYMLFHDSNHPCIRKGVLRAEKEVSDMSE